MLYRDPHDRQAPQEIKHIFHEHRPGSFQPFLYPQQKYEPLRCHPVIKEPFHKNSSYNYRERILDQEPEKEHQQGSQHDQDHNARIFRARDRGDRRHCRHDNGTGCDLVHNA